MADREEVPHVKNPLHLYLVERILGGFFGGFFVGDGF